MEASGAGLAGSTGADAGQDSGQQGNGGEAAQGFDPSAIVSQLEQNTGALEELRGLLTQQPQQDIQDDTSDVDMSWLDEGQELDPQVVQQQLTQLVDQRASELLKPYQERLEAAESQVRDRVVAEQVRDLTSEFPELNEPETAQRVVDQSKVLAQELGDPKLAGNPAFWRITYMLGRAVDAAGREGQVPDAANLEGAGGAGPAGGQQVDLDALKASIVNGGGKLGSRVLDF